MRQTFGFQSARRCTVEFRRQIAQHLHIVRRLEPARGDQRLGLDLVERVFQFGAPVGRVDVDQDQADAGGGELGDQPFRPVGRPDADAVALVETESQQARGKAVDPAGELVVGPALAGCTKDGGLVSGMARRDTREQVGDGLVQERRFGRSGHMGKAALRRDPRSGRRQHGSTSVSSRPPVRTRRRPGRWSPRRSACRPASCPRAGRRSCRRECSWRDGR